MITQLPVSDIECHAYPWDGQFTPDVLGAWEGLLEMLPQPPLFLQPAWTQAGCAAGLLTPWRSLVIKRDGDVVGLLLLERRTRWSAAIAAGCSPDLPPWLIAPGAEAAVHAGIAAWLQQESALGTLALGRHADPEFAQAICGACGWRARRQPVKPTFTIALPDTWEAYLDSLGSATRRTIRRREARLYEKCPDVDVEELTEPSAADAALSEIIRLYCHRWADELGGCMLDNGEYAHFYRQAVRWALEQGHGVIFTLRARGRLLAGQVAFYTPEQETLYCDLTARDLDEEFGKY
ncbi:MAG TPA: GNAT family N-acetyltransferase, partial [Armatimonadota bacterium]